MDLHLKQHEIVPNLKVLSYGIIDVYFEYAEYDAEESKLILLRDSDIVVSKFAVSSNTQLESWRILLSSIGVEIEFLEVG